MTTTTQSQKRRARRYVIRARGFARAELIVGHTRLVYDASQPGGSVTCDGGQVCDGLRGVGRPLTWTPALGPLARLIRREAQRVVSHDYSGYVRLPRTGVDRLLDRIDAARA